MSELTEDAAVAALEWALDETQHRETRSSGLAADALLDRVRWLLKYEHAAQGWHDARLCVDCYAEAPDHQSWCSVGTWTRAAKRVGLC